MVSTQLDEMKIKGLRKAIVLQPFHRRVVPPGRMSFILLLWCLSRLLPAPTAPPPKSRFVLKIKLGSKTKLHDPKCLNSRAKFYCSGPSFK